MKLGQVVLEKKVQDHHVIIRYMNMNDVEPLREYINKVSQERTYITFQGEEVTYDEEKRYIEDVAKKMKNGQVVKLVLMVDGKVAGTSEISLGVRTHNHVGGLGLSVAASVRGKGLGRLLLESITNEAKKELKGLHMIELSVFAINDVAIKLYESIGFKEVGRIPDKIWYKGNFVDEVVMILNV